MAVARGAEHGSSHVPESVTAASGRTVESRFVEPAAESPSRPPRYPLVDAIRAIAALSVLVFHAANAAYTAVPDQDWLGAVLARFNVGVPIFFVISGFLLYRPFVAARLGGRAAPRVRDYARRRVLRLVPAYGWR